MKIADIKVLTDGGPWAQHNMPCAKCGKNKAIMQLWDGTFQPCRSCQREGWKTVKIPKFLRVFFKD